MKPATILLLMVLLVSCSSAKDTISNDEINTAIAQTMVAQSGLTSEKELNIPKIATLESTSGVSQSPMNTLKIDITAIREKFEKRATEIAGKTIEPVIKVNHRTDTPQPNTKIAECIPENTQRQTGVVVDVIDGDTIEVKLANEDIARVRYIGIDTPEIGYFCGTEAKMENRELVEGSSVLLITDVSDSDQYNRLLRYVYVDDIVIKL